VAEQDDPRRRRANRVRDVGAQLRVRARRDRDLVLTAAVDDDQGHAGGHALEPGNGRQIDALGLQGRQRLPAEVVVADRRGHPDLRAEPRRRHRLVGPLAAAVAGEAPARDRLAGGRQPLARHHEVHVHRPDHHDVHGGE
jgi:hypothetical protein